MIIENGVLSGVMNEDIINGNFIIPDSVTKIENGAFANCYKLKLIVIPNSVTEILDNAFYACTDLLEITIPNSVSVIGYNTFSNCTNLMSIIIPDSVTKIGYGIFYKCKKLQSKKGNYKAFYKGLICNGMQYIPNEWKKVGGEIETYSWGLHYVTNLFDIFNYYAGDLEKDIEIWEVEVGDIVINSEYDSQKATNSIKPINKLNKQKIINILNNK